MSRPIRSVVAEGLAILLFCVVLFLPGLGRPALWDDDETRFASVAREMVATGDWVVPRFNGELADKPPLLFWMMASAFSIFGENAGAARAGSVIFSIITVLAVWWLVARLYDKTYARWAVLALATSLLFAAEARLATTDAALLALVTLSLAAAAGGWWDGAGKLRVGDGGLRAISSGRALMIGLLAGLGILCKGPAALLLPIATLWIFAWSMRCLISGSASLVHGWRALRAVRPLTILAGAFIAAAPWHAAVWRHSGGGWFEIFYGRHYLGRLTWLQPLTGVALSPPEGHGGFPFFQIVALFAGLFPWSVFLLLAAWRTFCGAAGRGGCGDRRPAEIFFALWLLVWIVAVSFSSTQLLHYSFPAYPAACVMIAVLIVDGFRKPSGLRRGWLYAAGAGLAVGGAILSAGALIAAEMMSFPALGRVAWVGAIPAACAIFFVMAVRRDARRVAVGIFAAGAIALSLVIFQVVGPAIGKGGEVDLLVAKAVENSQGHPRMASYRFTSPGLVWAADGHVTVCRSAGEVAAFLHSGPDAFAVVNADACDEISAALGHPVRPLMRCRPWSRRHEVVLLGPDS